MIPAISLAWFAAALPGQTKSQSVFVPDGGRLVGTCQVAPFGDKSAGGLRNHRYQQLITATDLGGRSAVTIHDLGFVSCLPGRRHFDSIEIIMAQTSRTSLSSTFATNLGKNVVTVLRQTDYDWHQPQNEWCRIGLERSYAYRRANGGNLVIQITVTGARLHIQKLGSPGHRAGGRELIVAANWTTTPTVGTRRRTGALKIELVLGRADLQLFGIGCFGSHGKAPTLLLVGDGRIGKSYGVALTQALPNAVALLSIGFARTQPVDLGFVGAPGCKVYHRDDYLLGMRADAMGFHRVALPVPGTVAPGLRAYFQFFTLDANANKLGVTVSNYGRLLTGH